MKLILYLLIPLCFSLASCKKEIIKVGSLGGVVYNEFQQPIEGAKIEIESSTFITGSNGIYSFGNLPVKEYTISASKEYFLTKIQQITIIADEKSLLDFILVAGEIYLNISDSILNVNSNSGSFNLSVNSNADWVIENKSTWIECSIDKGEGDKSLIIYYAKNQDISSRTDTLTFASGSIKRKFIIQQSAPIKVIKFEGRIGNQENNIKDTIYILFNKPVIIQNIISTVDYCLSEINYKQPVNSCAVLFSFPCAELGGKYPFSISVRDNDGNSITVGIEVPFYKSKLDIGGNITDFLLINDDKEVLISTYNPNKIIRYSIELDSITKTYDLATLISPVKLSFNPYNSKVYIMGSDPNTTDISYSYIDRPEVWTLNIQTGVISKILTVQPDEFDHPQVPSIFPLDLGFTKFGIGIILLDNEDASGLRWKLIDCTNNDIIYNYPGYNGIIDKYSWFENVYRNFDNSKLYLTEPYHWGDYGIFDGSSQNISILRPNSASGGHSLTPYRKADKFYARQLYTQFIIDPIGNQSQITTLDSRHEGHADFSYRVNEENLIFLCEAKSFSVPPIPNRFYVLNYNDGSILKSCDVIDGLTKFSTTIDGKYAVAYRQNIGTSYSFYVFRTEALY